MTTVLFKKELLENWRNKKWIWVPLVFILLAIMDPITNYYLPDILEAVGGMADGAVIELPDFSAADAIMMSLSQYSMLGVLVTVLLSMGAISGERKSGVLELVLVKPVSYTKFVVAKWLSLLSLIWSSFIIGMLASWYYTNLLYGDIAFTMLLAVIFYYGLWLIFICTISIFYNTLTRSPGLVAFLTIGTTLVISLLTSLLGTRTAWSPANLSTHLQELLITGDIPSALIYAAIVSVLLIIIVLLASIYSFKQVFNNRNE
ncbi:ABC transporter permease [Virgibacillus pantothenticus]|uniref:ABC transporter permease n=1 Tax=Virgibacillus pantothenticus TaxID=1473 RepID=A0A0L0QWF8_VIRPA|nr:ABC transporter permease subunit [Virgibacillus pantothenticus]KNE22518.1 ABC transporter permease [Virgibacillus pantothenticus]MED3739227.1 ABC transporter permease subunit [Virgibacillus pantothenticus]QTY16984.1 ABC transporter permease subunit [Virgibacillus pantothenticus]SIT11261.1 ABC-2 type transport system permease protein [Virgibacillus pantothenticus]